MISKIPSQLATNRWKGKQRRIGVTGGIGTGKSSVGRFLEETKNIPILDADIYSKEALAPEKEATIKIINRYGEAITNRRNQQVIINRKALGQIIFQNSKERQWVESIVHPIVQEMLETELKNKTDEKTIAIIAPLLFEANLTSLCSEIWVIHCSFNQQVERIVKRDLLSKEEAIERISSQLSMEIKINLADVVIENSGESLEWKEQVNNLI